MSSLLSLLSAQLNPIMDKLDKLIIAKKSAHGYLQNLLSVNYPGLHVYWVDKENRILLMNAAQEALFSQLPQKGIGKTVREVSQFLNVKEAEIQKIYLNNQQVLEEKRPMIFEEKYNGTLCLSYKSPFYDSTGEVEGVLGISTDITEQRGLQNLLAASKRATDIYLESILFSSQNNIYWMDIAGRIIGCNDQQARSLGFTNRMDLINKNIFDIGKARGWDPAVAQKIRRNDLEVMRTRKESIIEEAVFLKGEKRFYLSFKSPLLSDLDQVIGVLGIATDITLLKQTQKALEEAKQKAEEATKAKTWFIANMSHDIRTPLAGMLGAAEILAQKLPVEFRPEINALIKASDELLALLNNILMLSKHEMREVQNINTEPFDLYLLLNKLLELFTPLAKQKNLSLSLNYADDIPRQFVSIPILLQRIILNLISNALKFTEEGGVSIHVSLEEGAEIMGDLVPILITVTDTGPGIPKEFYEKVFENFFRLKPSFQDSQKGSGLGLTIARQFVRTLGGKIWVKSTMGQGSHFFIQLPFVLHKGDALSHGGETVIDSYMKSQLSTLGVPVSLEIKQSFAPDIQPLRVLLVEDHALIQKIVTHLLNHLNSHADVASTAIQAIQFAQENAYDLIFMDIGLQDQDGFWAAQQIRRLKSHIHTPIIALTAHSGVVAPEVLEQAGINEVIIKPITLERLRTCFQRYGLK